MILQDGEDEYRQTLEVRKDPHSAGTEDDIRLQTDMLIDIRKDMTAAVEAINRIEWVRRQLDDLQAVAKGVGVEAESILSNAGALVGTFVTLQGKLLELRATGPGQDFASWPVMLAGKLSYLAGAVSTADFRPTDQHLEVHQELKAELAEYQQELEGLLQNEQPAFNETLDENQLPRIAIGSES